ncbi:hypothetical protein F3W84_09180 [Ochrobactrum quorumnocens]|uniref:Uncharacterized protein n=1 Tax=Ochrobactrum quorumnocens TaxID=271865 RepID=A0A5N1JZ50_9HYPH|nr:hypothetical protein F3W84_09180 [[Ochrobactrum] quorumnocens]
MVGTSIPGISILERIPNSAKQFSGCALKQNIETGRSEPLRLKHALSNWTVLATSAVLCRMGIRCRLVLLF